MKYFNKEELITQIERDINYSMCIRLLNAYNRWQEDEKDGVDYIFNIDKQDDLICCIKGGMTSDDIVKLKNNGVSYFLFGINHRDVTPMNNDDMINTLVRTLDELLDYIIAYLY
jgi:hypothetical protein